MNKTEVIKQLKKAHFKQLFDKEAIERVLDEYAQQVSRKLEHHKDATVGLWATDRPDLIKDPQGVLFRIEFKK